MKGAAHIIATVLGVYAGLLGMEHGFFEVQQGPVVPGGIIITANGPPCQPELVWHACQPAMTLVPNMLVTGILAMVVGLALVVWAAAFVQRQGGGLTLMGLSILLLLTGGGFLPPFFGMIAGAAGAHINAPPGWMPPPAAWVRALSALWPWALVIYLVGVPVQWVLGQTSNDFMLSVGGALLPLEVLVLLLAVLSAFAHDAVRAAASDNPALTR